MRIIETAFLSSEQKEDLFRLWNDEYPEKLKHNNLHDLENYFSGLENLWHFLLINEGDEISGWAFSFQRDSETWFAIILPSKIKNMGFGSMLLDKLREKQAELNGWVIDHNNDRKQNGEVYSSPLAFYLKNNFMVQSSERLETEKISAVKIRWRK